VLDFSGNLYGKDISVELGQKIRDDREFADENELRDQIAADVLAIRAHNRTI
jgi:FAD synthase